MCGASIARLGAPGEWRSGSGSARGVAVLALEVMRAEDVDIGAQWSVTATTENSTRSGRATWAEYSKGASKQWCGKVGGVHGGLGVCSVSPISRPR